MIYNLENRIANNYLVSLDEGGYVLIDTGYDLSIARQTVPCKRFAEISNAS